MFIRILVPLDGSWVSRRILRDVLMLAEAADAEVTFAHVLRDDGVTIIGRDPVGSHISAADYLDEVVDEAQGVGVRARKVVLYGDPGDELVRYTVANDIDSIAMTSHGRSSLARLVLGSVADTVVRTSPVPVLIRHVPTADETQDLTLPRRILVPLDGSELAEQILPYALGFARLSQGSLLLLRVGEYHDIAALDPTLPLESIDPEITESIVEQQAAQIREYLANVVQRIETSDVPVTTMARFGMPAPTILRVAAHDDIDLVAMVTHGRAGVRRLALGSVATDLVQHSSRLLLLMSATAVRRGIASSA